MHLIKKIVPFLFLLTIALTTPSYGNEVNAHIETGNMHAKNGNHGQALASLNAAISKDSKNARAYKLRGHTYYAMGEYTKAFIDLDQVVRLIPNSANAYADRAIVYSMQGRHGLALADIERALEIKPDSHFAQAVRNKILENASAK